MKKLISLCMVMAIIFSITSCTGYYEDREGQARTPSGSRIQHGRNYQEVYEEFEISGFTNIKLEAIDDLIVGWFTKDGEVESVSVDGNPDYSPDDWYQADVEVIIFYHTFVDQEKDDKINDDTQTEDNNQTVDESVNDSQTKLNEAMGYSATEILTTANCQDLAAMLALDADMDDSYKEFVDKYRFNTIEFDGCINYIYVNREHGTLYNMLISAGDYVDENAENPGPTFRLENIPIYSFGTGSMVPVFIKVGSNIKIKAEVIDYIPDTGMFELYLVSIEER